jgi:hypothetical protein
VVKEINLILINKAKQTLPGSKHSASGTSNNSPAAADKKPTYWSDSPYPTYDHFGSCYIMEEIKNLSSCQRILKKLK